MKVVRAVGRVAVKEAVGHEAVTAVETRETTEVVAALAEMVVPHLPTTYSSLRPHLALLLLALGVHLERLEPLDLHDGVEAPLLLLPLLLDDLLLRALRQEGEGGRGVRVGVRVRFSMPCRCRAGGVGRGATRAGVARRGQGGVAGERGRGGRKEGWPEAGVAGGGGGGHLRVADGDDLGVEHHL